MTTTTGFQVWEEGKRVRIRMPKHKPAERQTKRECRDRGYSAWMAETDDVTPLKAGKR